MERKRKKKEGSMFTFVEYRVIILRDEQIFIEENKQDYHIIFEEYEFCIVLTRKRVYYKMEEKRKNKYKHIKKITKNENN